MALFLQGFSGQDAKDAEGGGGWEGKERKSHHAGTVLQEALREGAGFL